jgi:hypothetical protein
MTPHLIPIFNALLPVLKMQENTLNCSTTSGNPLWLLLQFIQNQRHSVNQSNFRKKQYSIAEISQLLTSSVDARRRHSDGEEDVEPEQGDDLGMYKMVVAANLSVMVVCLAKRLSSSAAKTAAAERTPRTRKDARSKRTNWAALAPQ